MLSPDAGQTGAPPPDGVWVNVGAGPEGAEGWLCIDGSWQARLAGHPMASRLAAWVSGRPVGHWSPNLVCRDVRRGFGLADGSAAVVFSSHLIEHLFRSEAVALLREARRVLKPGGVCRIVTPDLGALVARYLEMRKTDPPGRAADAFQDAALLQSSAPQHARGLLGEYRRRTDFDRHKWLYDGDSLCAIFREAGFVAPRVCGHLESAIPAGRLLAVEHPSRVLDGQGICVEGRRDA